MFLFRKPYNPFFFGHEERNGVGRTQKQARRSCTKIYSRFSIGFNRSDSDLLITANVGCTHPTNNELASPWVCESGLGICGNWWSRGWNEGLEMRWDAINHAVVWLEEESGAEGYSRRIIDAMSYE